MSTVTELAPAPNIQPDSPEGREDQAAKVLNPHQMVENAINGAVADVAERSWEDSGLNSTLAEQIKRLKDIEFDLMAKRDPSTPEDEYEEALAYATSEREDREYKLHALEVVKEEDASGATPRDTASLVTAEFRPVRTLNGDPADESHTDE